MLISSLTRKILRSLKVLNKVTNNRVQSYVRRVRVNRLSSEINSSKIDLKQTNTIDLIKSDLNELKEDINVPKSKVSCPGCGAHFHCQNKSQEGFLPVDKFKSLTKHELVFTYCHRCELLSKDSKLINVETNTFDYDKFILDKICSEKKAHVILLIDLLDMPNSIYSGWSKLIEAKNNIDICVIGNKFDLLPNTGPIFHKSIIECLAMQCAAKGIRGERIKYVELISAKTGYNIEKLISSLFKLFNDEGDVYLLGTTNAGKSVLFNQFLKSDYCRTLASNAIQRAMTSFWPGTTLNMLKFPITFLNDKKARLRAERLQNDSNLFEKIENERSKMYEKDHDLKHAECLGIVGRSFDPLVTSHKNQIESSYSLDSNTGMINEGENYESVANVEETLVNQSRELYRPNYYENKSAFLYDTPGLLHSHEILRNFSKQELQLIFPLGVIMPRVYWMQPGQTMFISGLMRIDLLESTDNQRVLFTIMASPALPIVNPFNTNEADKKYDELYEHSTVLRVPYKHNKREKDLPKLESKTYEINCIGNHKSISDIVFSCYGWCAVTSLPNVKAKIRAFTPGSIGLQLRQPSLLPFIVNMRSQWFRKDGSQAFKSKYYTKPKINLSY